MTSGQVHVIVSHYEPFFQYAHSVRSAAGLGIGFGIVLTVLAAVFLLPFQFGVIGATDVIDVPTITAEIAAVSLVGHMLFGLVVALTYAMRTD